VLASGTAQVYLYGNVLPASRAETPISYRNGRVKVGPFTAGAGAVVICHRDAASPGEADAENRQTQGLTGGHNG